MNDRLAFAPSAWAGMEQLLPAGWVDAFFALGGIMRKRQYQSAAQALYAVLAYIADSRSYEAVAMDLALRRVVAESGQALYQRFCAVGPFLGWLVEHLTLPRTPHPRWRRPVLAIDATVVTRRGSTGTDVRVHTLVDVTSGRVVAARVTDERVGEHLSTVPVQRRDLILADRGYGHRAGIASVLHARADVVVRVARTHLPLWAAPQIRLDPTALLAQVPAHGVLRRRAGVPLPDDTWCWGTLLITRTGGEDPEAQADDPWAGYLVLWTTLPYRQATAAIAALYRERWRVERFYCRMKTTGGTDRAPHRQPRNALTWTAGRVVLIQLADLLLAQAEAALPAPGPRATRPAQSGKGVPALL